jgi:hypothetical protein
MQVRIAVLLCVALAGCARGIPEAKPFEGTVVSRQQLAYTATGITIDEQGRRLAWNPSRGLVTIDTDELILPAETVSQQVAIGPQPGPVEDVVAIPGGRFGVIARNEGRIFRSDGVLVSRFCYLPGGFNPAQPTVSQLSKAIGFGEEEGRIYVQPQTFQDTVPVDSQLGQFEIGNDQPLEWQKTPELDGLAGGLVVTAPHRMLIGLGSKLYEYDSASQAYLRTVDLSASVFDIEGLAIDREKNTLLVLDGSSRQVLELSR